MDQHITKVAHAVRGAQADGAVLDFGFTAIRVRATECEGSRALLDEDGGRSVQGSGEGGAGIVAADEKGSIGLRHVGNDQLVAEDGA